MFISRESPYPDFQLTTNNCDQEPIHRPLWVQGHGHLLVFDAAHPGQLYAMSDGLPAWLGRAAEELWGGNPQQWMPRAMYEVYREMCESQAWDPVDPFRLNWQGHAYNLIRHHYKGKLFLEIEPLPMVNGRRLSTFRAIRQVMEPLQEVDHLAELFRTVARQLKTVMGYDRVMVYQFDPEGHGEVVGEAVEPHLEPFLGLRYPATDIPPMARALFLKNRSRIITDITLPPHQLAFRPDLEQVPYLDLSYSQLRGTSPVHLQYLANMGVRATMTLAIVLEGKLWGLFACHHYRPHLVSFEMRKTGEVIASLFAQRLNEVMALEKERATQAYRKQEQRILDQIHAHEDVNTQLLDRQPDLLALCAADGAAFVTLENQGYIQGETPEKAELFRIRNWLLTQKKGPLFATQDLAADLPLASEWPQTWGGLMAVQVSEFAEGFLLWFRKPQRQEVNWAGDPEKPFEVQMQTEGQPVLSPRHSFAKWQVAIENQGLPWSANDQEMAQRLREGLLRKGLERSVVKAHQMRQEFEQLTYVASHDLVEPLRTISNYVELLEENFQEGNEEEFQQHYQRVTTAAQRMHGLIQDMLDYSRIGQEAGKEPCPLTEVLQEIREQMHSSLQASGVELAVGPLPVIRADRSAMLRLFQNLISNAVKYRRPGIAPYVRVLARREAHHWLISIADNGIGIPEKDFERIFWLFRRLHRKEEYEGTGIGLAQCKKIVESLDGSLWVTSTLGEGSTFWIRWHESHFALP